MKNYKYIWSEEKYVIHIEANAGKILPICVNAERSYKNGSSTKEELKIAALNLRFIISKKNPQEEYIEFFYDDDTVLSFYEIEDNAFYPIKPIIIL